MVGFLGTDMHHAKHLEALKAMQRDGKLVRFVRGYRILS